MLFLSASMFTTVYHVIALSAYACIAAILLLALIFGRRARRNVKKERITKLPDGFSPLDVKRIFIGKSYPRRLTRALIAHWAQRGYIKVKQLSKYRVQLIKLAPMPPHFDESAFFFDRGTYVRERDLFDYAIKHSTDKGINLLKPMFPKDFAKSVSSRYAVREDEGVYTARHYRLKITTLVLSVIPLILSVVWCGIDTHNFMGLLLIGTAVIGLFVFMFVRDMPIAFKIVWCGMWLGASIGGLAAMFISITYDPLYMGYSAIGIFFLGPLFFIRFVDYRAKNNLAEYSDLMNFRKFLLFAPKSEVSKLDYYEVLPFLYAFNIKTLVSRKFDNRDRTPDWFISNSERSVLL